MKIYFCLLFLLWICYVGCMSNSNSSFTSEDVEKVNIGMSSRIEIKGNTPIEIDLNDAVGEHETNSTALIDTMFFVPLQTTAESIFEQPYKLIVCNDRVYLMDMQLNLLVFDIGGNFITSLKKGNGPGEVSNIMAMAVNDKQQFVVIQKKHFTYYDKNGCFLNKMEKMPLNTDEFGMTDWGYIFFQVSFENSHLGNEANYSLLLADTNLSVFNKGISPINRGLFVREGNMLVATDSSYLVSQFLNDTIYEIYRKNKPTVSVKYVLDYKKKKVENVERLATSDKYYNSACVIENPHTQVFKFNSENVGRCIVLRDKTTGKTVGCSLEVSDRTAPGYLHNTMTVSNGYFVSWMFPRKGMEFNHPSISDLDRQKVANLDEEDNVVLIFYKIK